MMDVEFNQNLPKASLMKNGISLSRETLRQQPPLHIAFCAVPMMGHFSPLVPYVVELLNRGHTITFFHESSSKYRQMLERSIHDKKLIERCTSVPLRCSSTPGSGGTINLSKWGDILYEGILSYYNKPHHSYSSEEKHLVKPDVMVYDFFAPDGADAMDSLSKKGKVRLTIETKGIPSVGVYPNPRSINPWAATVEEQSTTKWKLWCSFMWFMEGVAARILWCKRSFSRLKRRLPPLSEQDIYPSPWMPRLIIGCTSKYIEFPNLPSAPLYHMVGPSLNQTSKKEQRQQLDDEIEANLFQWVQSNDHMHRPIIYVAFGTMYKHNEKSARKLQQELLNLIRESDNSVAVLWSLPKDQQKFLLKQQSKQEKNSLDEGGNGKESGPHYLLRIESYVPQVALLQSGCIKVFVTHCGSNSVYEALLSAVPMVCCPNMADQPANATRLARAGVAVIAKNRKSNNSDSITMAVQQILNNSSFTDTSRHLAMKLLNQNGAQNAADIIENAARQQKKRDGEALVAFLDNKKRRGRLPWGTALFIAGAATFFIVFLCLLLPNERHKQYYLKEQKVFSLRQKLHSTHSLTFLKHVCDRLQKISS